MTDMSIALHLTPADGEKKKKPKRSVRLYVTPPQAEKKAAKELRRDGIKAIVPRYKLKKRTSHNVRGEKTVTKILAPGYVLAKGNVRYSHYVRHKIGGITPAEAYRMLKQGRQQSQAKQAPQRLWAIGDVVTITVGPFASITGKIIEHKGRTVRIEHEGGRTIAVSVYHLTRPSE